MKPENRGEVWRWLRTKCSRLLRLNVNSTLKSGGRGATGGRGHQRFRQFLIVGQFALAMVLLTGAAFLFAG